MDVNEHVKLDCITLRRKLKLRTVSLLLLGQKNILYQIFVSTVS
jgi:hypothetical protein